MKRGLLVAALILVALVASDARADDDVAREHFRRGVGLYDKKEYQPALEEFRAAYREKPSAGIKQNIALSLVGLGRRVEAATTFDEALDEGQGTLKPETRAAIEHELEDLAKVVATVHVVVLGEDRKPIDGAILTINGNALPRGATRRVIRLEPGLYTLGVRVDGRPSPPDKRLGLEAGAPVDATFEIGGGVAVTGEGTLTVHPSVEGARVRVDGKDVGTGAWTGKLPAGSHEVQLSADGWQTTNTTVVVNAGASVDYPITLRKPGEIPDVYVAPKREPPLAPKKIYLFLGAVLEGETLRMSSAVDEPLGSGNTHPFSGIAAEVRGGYRLSRYFALELLGELGAMGAEYKINPADPLDTSATVVHWQFTPLARFTSPGSVRFTAATGAGVHGTAVTAKLAEKPGIRTVSGSGVSGSWLFDIGAQFDAGPLFFELALLLDVHGVGSVKDAAGTRIFFASPATRAGLRLGFAIPF